MEKMWTYLIHLGSNMWGKKGQEIIDEERSIYRDFLYCDKEIWRKVTDFLPTCGINTLIIDMGEGVRLDSHPELAVEGSWSKEEFRAELARLRSIGLTPIPKYNFSCCHNAWMKDYAYMVGTETYYKVCKDIIEEAIDLFDTPAFFHLGMDEENLALQEGMSIAIIRNAKKRIEDCNFYFDVCRAKGVRPWIWVDESDIRAFGGDKAFCEAIGKDVLLSNWFYKRFPKNFDPRADAATDYATGAAKLYYKLSEWGYDQVPTGSTWSWNLNNKETMRFCKTYAKDEKILGYMTAPWLFTVPQKYYALLNDAFNFGNAKKDIYPE